MLAATFSSEQNLSYSRTVTIEQECSSRDISRSSMAEASENSGNRWLLPLKLTDGHSEITAMEYQTVQLQKNNATTDGLTDGVKPLHTTEGNPEKATASERPKGRLNAASGSLMMDQPQHYLPVKVSNINFLIVNSGAYTTKTSHPSFGDRNPKFQRRMGKDTEDDLSLLTLDEWETRMSGSGPQSITITLKMRSLQDSCRSNLI
ncbi:hypothetical protein SASPL_112739 [Salvia splendens]|uniref:Uncharacterized protein n=1 Tax=Salvia splendens TaxID=180675 RepID=A0A8X9A4H4_SALSN|nr:hypothetical protein SASPL_112739 [Salvia splendens]